MDYGKKPPTPGGTPEVEMSPWWWVTIPAPGGVMAAESGSEAARRAAALIRLGLIEPSL